MVLNNRGRGRGRGGRIPYFNKGPGRGMRQGPMFRPGPPGMFGPPQMGFNPEPKFGVPFFPGPSTFNFQGPPRPPFGKFPRKNIKRKVPQKSNSPIPVPEIDLTKPWVTDDIKKEDASKERLLQDWRLSKSDEDWNKYKSQKQNVKNLYEKAKEQYLATRPEEAHLLQNNTITKKYFCETCDKTFWSDDDLILHEAEHETCGRDGCEFTAHPKVIAKHIKMQHDSGLYKRIGKLYTEEEINKWLQERKRRYPSRQVIEEKKALEQEKIKRGERIKDDNSKFNKEFQNKSKSKNKPNRLRNRKKKKKMAPISLISMEKEALDRKGVAPFLGIGNTSEPNDLLEKKKTVSDIDISDEEWGVADKVNTVCQPLINNSLGLLASAYDSEEETMKVECQHVNNIENFSDNGEDSPPEEVKTVLSKKEDMEENDETHYKERKRKIKRDFTKNKKLNSSISESDYHCRSLTLLEKLLRKEIRHERNVILQCVNYVVKNNFFDVT